MKSTSLPSPQEKDWDRFWGGGNAPRSISWSKRRILAVLSGLIRPGAKVLDAGCGSGFFSVWFLAQGCHVTALDYSQKALDKARDLTGGKVSLLKADLLVDDLARISPVRFDLIFTDGLFEHFSQDDQDKIMKNFLSVLTPMGRIVTFVPNRFSPWELVRPLYMPGIKEWPFILSQLIRLNQRNGLMLERGGGVNTLPFLLSPEGPVASVFGMLLFSIARR